MAFIAELARSLPFILGLITVVLLALLFELGRRLAQAAELATDTLDDDATSLETASENGEAVVLDWRTSSAAAALKRSFATVRRLLREMLPGSRPQYQIPWYLSLGPAGGGKTTLLGQTRLIPPLGGPDAAAGTAPRGCHWWLFDRAVVLDTDGDLVLEAASTQSEETIWRDLLKQLRRRRARRPADGMLLSIPASELTVFQAGDPDAEEALAERAGVLRRKLWRAQERLGMQLPVYLLITKCDLLPGFGHLVARLSDDRRRQIFGWSVSDPPETAYSGGSVDTAFTSVELALARFQLRALSATSDAAQARDFVAFPAALEQLKEPLRIYMNQIFSATANAEPFPFRGLYFLGGAGFEADDEPSLHPTPAAATSWVEAEVGSPPRNAHRRVDFLGDLLDGKILYEWNLAQPTAKAERTGRRWSWALQAALLAGLLLGPLGVWAGVTLSSSRAATLDQQLLDPILGTPAPGEASTEQLHERAGLALEAAGQVSKYSLHTGLLPWGGKADHNLARAMTAVYRDTVFPATRQDIDRQLADFAEPAAVGRAKTRIWDVEATPELRALTARTSRLRELERDADSYNCFAPEPCSTGASDHLQIFRRLIESVYRTELDFPTRSARKFYAGVLNGVRVSSYAPTDSRSGIRDQTLALSDTMFDRLFGSPAFPDGTGYDENVVSRDLRDLGDQIRELANRTSGGAAAHRRLFDTIERAEKDLARPEVAWAGKEQLDLGDAFNSWINSVRGSRQLGPEVAAEILRCANGDSSCTDGTPRRDPPASFADFRHRLTEAAAKPASAYGPLLATEDDKVQLQLSAEMQELKGALASLLGESFMQPAKGLALSACAQPEEALFWTREPLEEAAALIDGFEGFSEEGFAGFKRLEPAAREAALGALEAQLLDRVAQAQDFVDAPPLFSKSLQKEHIAQQVASLQEATEYLDRILGTLAAPPAAALTPGACVEYCTNRPASGWCLVSAILESQQRDLLQQIDALLEVQAFYSPRDGNFSWWDGTGNLAHQAFGVASDDDLATWLAGQQQQVSTLAQDYAGAVLKLKTKDCLGYASLVPSRRFKVLLEDFADFDSGTAGNALAATEELITQTMTATSRQSCLKDTALKASCFAASTSIKLKRRPPCDYFLGRRDYLVDGIKDSCEELTVDAARTAWKDVTESFVSRLQDKFPFIEGSGKPEELPGPQVQPVTVDDIERFYRVFDRQRAKVEGFLEVAYRHRDDNPPRFDQGKVKDMRCFMARIGDRRDETAGDEASNGADGNGAASNGAPTRKAPAPSAKDCDQTESEDATETDGEEDDDEKERAQRDPGGVRDLFSYFLAALDDDPAAEPVFDLQVQFRVNQAKEVAANQVISWTFEVGDAKIEPGDIDPPGRWNHGEPVRLSMAWAANAATAPLTPGLPNTRLIDRTVIYEFEDPWSLFSMLRRHKPSTEDFPALVDDNPETLVFSIPVHHLEPEPAQPTAAKGGFWSFLRLKRKEDPDEVDPPATGGPDPDLTAKAFIRVTLMAPDGSKADLRFPRFPTRVPPFPSGGS